MRYEIDFLNTFDKTFLFWIQNFIRSKLTTLSNRQVNDKDVFQKILKTLSQELNSMEELKTLAKQA